MSYSYSKQRFLQGIKCLKDNVNIDQFVNYLQREEKITKVSWSNRCDNTLRYKTLPNPLPQSGQSACENYRTVQKFEGTLSMLPGFKEKNGINQIELYQRIKNVLTSKTALAYMSFIVHVCQYFKRTFCSFVIH